MFKSIQGQCLLASPFMDDPNFYRSVVYLIRHTEEDAFGVILNRPTDYSLVKVVSMVCECECVHDGWLHCGGPVDGPLLAMHDQPQWSAMSCVPGVYLTSDQEELVHLFECRNAKLKLFDGFAGWGPGQLDDELQTGSWLVSDIEAADILGSDSNLWESLTHRIGHSILADTGRILDGPANPQWN